MDFLEKNIELLKKLRPGIHERIDKVISEKKYSFECFSLLDTRKSIQAIEINKFGEKVRLNSLYDPEKEAEHWAKQYDFNNIGVSVVMFGIANGVFANTMLNGLKDDSIVFLVEPDVSLFIYCLENFDMSNIISDERVRLYIEEINANDLYFDLIQNIHWTMIPTQIACFYPGMDKIYCEKAKEFAQLMQKFYSAENSVNYTASYLARMSTRNVINNLHFIKESNYMPEFSGILPDDVPVIIVAAGPSLDKNIEELKRAEKKSFIIATDTAVKFLIAHNVHYDVIVTIDPRKSLNHLSDERCFSHPIFTIMDAKNEILEMNQGRKIWINGAGFMEALYIRYGLTFTGYISGGSVATAAFNVARAMNAKRIVLIGQDLAFSGESTHAGGVANHSDDDRNGIVYVEDIYGNQIKSRGDWIIYINWFSATIEELGDSVDVIDATEGGAKLKGSRIMKLSDVIDEYCKSYFDFEKVLMDLSPTFSDKEYQILKEDLFHMQKELTNIRKYAKDGISASKEMIKIVKSGKSSPKKENKCIKTVKKANNFIEKQLVYSILDDYIATDLNDKLKDINCLTEDENENIIKTYDMSKSAFEAILNGVDEITPILENALKKL